MIGVEKTTCYKMNGLDVQKIIQDFIEKKYGYLPKMHISLNHGIWLPIEVQIKPEDNDEFNAFWSQLLMDLYRIENKKDDFDDFDFELGDKLLQMILGKPTVEYIFHEYESSVVYVLVDEEKKIPYVSKEKLIEKEGKLLAQKAKMSVFSDEIGKEFETKSLKFTSKMVVFDEELALYEFFHENGEHLSFWIEFLDHIGKENTVNVKFGIYTSHEETVKEAMIVGEKITNFLESLSFRVVVENGFKIVPIPLLKHEALTPLENAVLAMCLEGYTYDQISYAVDKKKKAIDNTIQRIRKKEMEGKVHIDWKTKSRP